MSSPGPLLANVSRRALIMGAAAGAVAPRLAWGRSAERPSQAVEQRIRTLIAAMTLEEKAGQLTLMNAAFVLPNAVTTNVGLATDQAAEQREIEAGRLGGVFNGAGAAWAKRLQDAAKRSRLKIPLIIGADVIHGFKTVFPVPLAEAAAFDPDLAERTARASATEAAAAGIAWTFAPMVDIARDARWGRMVEGAGEDVLLGRRLATARVRGFQGAGLDRPDAVLACAKHFAAYGAAEGGRDYGPTDMSDRTLREVYLPPFRAASDAGALTMMAGFNEIGGVPCTGNHYLLEDVLRGEWSFEGFVVSDWNGDAEMVQHGFAADPRDAARRAILAGTDMSMRSWLYRDHLPALVRSGEVPEARIDQAVARVLRVKFRLGLFDNPYNRVNAARERSTAYAAAHGALALEAARKSIVLLRNEGSVLPVRRDARIALIGPFGDSRDVNGSWTLYAGPGESLAGGLRRALGDPSRLAIVAGSDVDAPLDGGIAHAVAAARGADVVLLAVGESSAMSGEARSRAAIVLPQAQQVLAEAVAATGKPVVVLLRAGRGLVLEGAVRNAAAILVTWHLGTRTADAVADVVFGTVSPSGRLPISFPQTTGQVPMYYARHPSGRPFDGDGPNRFGTGYLDYGTRPLYPFGHGLGYGSVRYEALSLDRMTIRGDERVRASVRLINDGPRAVQETVQLYVTKPTGLIAKPRKEMIDFRKVDLASGTSMTVAFDLTVDDLSQVLLDRKTATVPGIATVWIAPSALDGLSAPINVRA